MNLKQLTSGLFVSEQILVSELNEIAEHGIRTIINNRPDNEAISQPDSVILAEVAIDLGLEYRHIPIVPGSDIQNEVRVFSETLKNTEGPTLAFCRSGMRSTILWAMSIAGVECIDTVIKTAANAGYDLESLRIQLLASVVSKQA